MLHGARMPNGFVFLHANFRIVSLLFCSLSSYWKLIIYIFDIGTHNAATKVFGNFASLQQLESKKWFCTFTLRQEGRNTNFLKTLVLLYHIQSYLIDLFLFFICQSLENDALSDTKRKDTPQWQLFLFISPSSQRLLEAGGEETDIRFNSWTKRPLNSSWKFFFRK